MAKKHNSAYDGTPIQIKRTTLSLDDTISGGKAAIKNDGPLKYGEPLYLQYDVTEPNPRVEHTHQVKYMVIGEGVSTGDDANIETDRLKVFKAVPRDLAEGILFYDQTTRKPSDCPISTNGERVDLLDQEGLSIFPKFRTFTMRANYGTDPATMLHNVPVDANNKPIKITMNGTWFKVDDEGKITDTPVGKGVFPKAQYIDVANMTPDTIPYISLAIPDDILGDKNETKQTRKSFGNITHVRSESGKIIVFCSYKDLKRDCYLDVFGG